MFVFYLLVKLKTFILESSEAEVLRLQRKLRDSEEEHSGEVSRLRRQLEEETFTKTSLERKVSYC